MHSSFVALQSTNWVKAVRHWRKCARSITCAMAGNQRHEWNRFDLAERALPAVHAGGVEEWREGGDEVAGKDCPGLRIVDPNVPLRRRIAREVDIQLPPRDVAPPALRDGVGGNEVGSVVHRREICADVGFYVEGHLLMRKIVLGALPAVLEEPGQRPKHRVRRDDARFGIDGADLLRSRRYDRGASGC